MVRLGMGNEGRFSSAARYGAKLGEETYGRFSQEFGAGRVLSFQSYVDASSYEMDQSTFEQHFDTLDLDLQYQTPVGIGIT